MAATPPPAPGPNETVAEMHAYAADDYALNPSAREPRSPRGSTSETDDGFVVVPPRSS